MDNFLASNYKPLAVLALFIALSFFNPQQTAAQEEISLEEFESIEGQWTGSLTYLDYQTQAPFSMPAELVVEKGKKQGQLLLQYIYPNEPKANSKGKLTQSKDGTSINGNKIVSRRVLENQDLEIQSQYTGKDDNKKALIRTTYVFGATQLIIRKEVQFSDAEAWIKRNEYQFNRK